MPSETTYKLTLGIGYANAGHEEKLTIEEMGYSESEWKELAEDEKDIALEEAWREWSSNHIEGGWEKL